MYISTIHQFESIPILKQNGIDAIIVGIPDFSIRNCNTVSLEDLKIWKKECDRNNLKLYINFLKLIHEQELEEVELTLSYLKEIKVDGIYFADEGILYIAKKLHMESICIYQPETLITNSNDILFYLNEGIQSVSLAHELSLEEIRKIASKNHSFEILISGYYSILYSRRPLISNYFKAIQKEKEKEQYTLIESTRTGKMPIMEDENGTYIFSEQPVESYDQLEELKKLNIERFRIDSIFFDDQWTIDVLGSYLEKKNYIPGCSKWYYQESIKKKEKKDE